MTAHNIPIWKFMIILSKMMDEGFLIMDITINDEMEIMLKGIKEMEDEQREKPRDINWEETI